MRRPVTKYVLTFALLAWAVLTMRLGGWGYLLLWPAVSFLLVAALLIARGVVSSVEEAERYLVQR